MFHTIESNGEYWNQRDGFQPEMEKAATFGNRRTATLSLLFLQVASAYPSRTVELVTYDGAWIKTAPRKVVQTLYGSNDATGASE